jgi:hypothetical protein
MRSYGFIPICFNQIDSSSGRVWGFQDDFFTLFALIITGGFLFMEPMELEFVAARTVYLRAGVDQGAGG